MTQMTVDVEDLVALPVFILGNLAQLGTYGPDGAIPAVLGNTLYTLKAGGYTTQISIGLGLALAALAWVLYTNDIGLSGWSTMQTWLVVVVVWLTLSPPFVPVMGTLLGSTIAATIAVAVQSLGYIALLYIG